MNNEEVFGFFDTLLNDYPDCKFLNYNLKRTGRFLEPEELFKLAELHSNFCAIKHTRVDDSDISAISSSCTPLQFFVTEKNFLRLSEKTECGLLMSISNINLDLARDFYEACVKRDFVAAGKIMDIFWEARSAMIDSVEFRAIDGVYDKLYTKYNISEFPLRLLPPYQCASEEVFKKFKYKSDQLINSIQVK